MKRWKNNPKVDKIKITAEDEKRDEISLNMETKELSNLFVISDLFASGGKQAPAKIAISQTGVYTPAFGRAREITGEMFDMMIENFKRNTLGSKLSVYYSHWDSKRAAAAEIKNIYKGVADNSPSKSVLYAEVEWTPKGKKAILDKEYKYISAEFAYNLKRPKDEDESVFEEFGDCFNRSCIDE